MFLTISNIVNNTLEADKRTHYMATLGSINETIQEVTNSYRWNIGKTVIVQSTSSGATVTFIDSASGVSTLNRILTPTGDDVSLTGSSWTATLYSTSLGWVLSYIL